MAIFTIRIDIVLKWKGGILMTYWVNMGNYMFFGNDPSAPSILKSSLRFVYPVILYYKEKTYIKLMLILINKPTTKNFRHVQNSGFSRLWLDLEFLGLTRKWLAKDDCCLVWCWTMSSVFAHHWGENVVVRSSMLLWGEISWGGTMGNVGWEEA